ncbi:MAG: 2-amino-4-hydroxy-6-hydroxymethyldihydropteridine diphosphokinase [Parafilimonas sp.]
MNNAFLLTGGNLGNREYNLQKGKILIEKYGGKIMLQSSVYQTAPWGYAEQPDFYNQALQLQTLLTAEILMKILLQIEEKMGRERLIKLGPRIIDIDILLMNDDIINSAVLKIPHPQLSERRFALMPLAEIAAEKIHPVLNKSISQLLAECTDTLPVHKILST